MPVCMSWCLLSAHVWQTQCTLAHELAGFLYCKQDALHELWPDSCSTSAMPLHELACFMCLARAVHELVCFMDHNCKAPCTSWPTSGIAEYVDGDSEDIDFLTRALPSFIVRQRTTPLCHSSCHLLTFLHLTGIVPAISDACMWSHSVLVVYHPDFEKCRDHSSVQLERKALWATSKVALSQQLVGGAVGGGAIQGLWGGCWPIAFY